MSNQHPWSDFFRRLNTVLGTLILLGILTAIAIPLISAWLTHDDAAIQLSTDPKDKESKTLKLRMGELVTISGHRHHYVELRSHADAGYSSYGNHRTRNLLFVDEDNLESHWLFPTQQQLILKITHLSRDAPNDNPEVLALLYDVIQTDDNQDGKLDSEDQITIAISRADGSKYQVLSSGLTKVISRKVSNDGDRLLVLSQKNDTVRLDSFMTGDFSRQDGKVLATLTP